MNNKLTLGIAIAVGCVGLAALGYYKQSTSMSDSASVKNRADVEKIIREYIVENPEFLEDAMKNLYNKKQKAENEEAAKAVKEKVKELAEDPTDPFIGSATPKVTIVEFFDQNCGYCKRMIDVKSKITNELKDVKIVFKEFPILGENSRMLAKAALAVNIVDKSKYFEFHSKVMHADGVKDEAAVEVIVQGLGIDLAKYKAAYAGDEVAKKLDANAKLAAEIGLRGTPAYVVGDQLIPGAISFEEIKKLVEQSSK